MWRISSLGRAPALPQVHMCHSYDIYLIFDLKLTYFFWYIRVTCENSDKEREAAMVISEADIPRQGKN